MSRFRAILLSLCFLALPTCAVFEDLLSNFSRFVDDNDDGPLFAYSIDQEPPLVRIAVLTDDDAGLILRATDLRIERSEIINFILTPNGNFLGGSFDEIFADVADFGVFVINTSTAEIEVLRTDNTIGLDDEIACRLTDLQVVADRLARDYVALVFSDRDIPPASVTGEIGVADDSGNSLQFRGWNSQTSFVADYSLMAELQVVVPDESIDLPYDIGPIPVIEGELQFRRVTGGDWIIDGCPGSIPAVIPPPAPVRNLTLSSEGRLILDGAELEGALGSGAPMEVRPVTILSGPVDR